MAEAPVFGCFSIGTVAETYNDLYVPRLFSPWAKLLIERVGLRPGDGVLDLACGPGTVARLALSPSDHLVESSAPISARR